MSAKARKRSSDGNTMDVMPPVHAKPGPKDYLWVLAVIAACALIKVSPSWVGIAAAAGFPRFGRMPTDWTLAVIMEAYWAYALYAWLAAASGVRSRRFAMWSAAAVFALSLAGQSAARLVGSGVMTAFANGMPVVVLALIAILIHLRQLDRADAARVALAARRAAAEVQREAAEASELDALRTEMAVLGETLGTVQGERDTARAEAAAFAAKIETLTRKLAARRTPVSDPKSRKSKRDPAPADDLTTEFRALDEFQKDPSLRQPRMGAELARRLGVSPATGNRLHSRLAGRNDSADRSVSESVQQPDERSDERS